MMVGKLKLGGLYKINEKPRIDNRGFLRRLYDKKIFEKFHFNADWVQLSHVYTERKNTLRGLHVALEPYLEAKLVTVLRGKVLWIAADLRTHSRTFGSWDSTELSSKENDMLLINRGFGNGCLSLTDQCDLVIMSDNYFSEENSTGIIWNDPDLNIDWQLGDAAPIISERDRNYGTFKEFELRHCKQKGDAR